MGDVEGRGLGRVSPEALIEDAVTAFERDWASSPARFGVSTAQVAWVDLDTVRGFVRVVDRCIARWNDAAHLREPAASLVWANAVSSSLPVLMLWRRGKASVAAQRLLLVWEASVTALTDQPRPTWEVAGRAPSGEENAIAAQESDAASLPSFAVAVSELIAQRSARDQARMTLDRLRAYLALDDGELERWLGATGPAQMRPEALSRLGGARMALDRLLSLFKADSLPEVIRRPAELFDGKRALDWILEGRIAEVADRYDMALSYQA